MNIRKLETRQPWLCEVDGTTYVRTEIQWNDDRSNDVTWHLNEDQVKGKACFTDEQLEKLFWENNVKINKKELKKEILEEDLEEIKNIRFWLKNKKDLCDKIILKK
jgi:hypothetical protein